MTLREWCTLPPVQNFRGSQISKHNVLGTCEEWIRDLDFKGLGSLASSSSLSDDRLFSSLFMFDLAHFGCDFLRLFGNLVASLLQLVILVINDFLE